MQGAYNAGDPQANILWTAPRNGTINIRGRTWDAYGGRPGAWTLYVGGSQVAGGSIVASSKRTSVGVTFAENILPGQRITKVPVDAGTQIVFNQYNGSVGVEMTISYVNQYSLTINSEYKGETVGNPLGAGTYAHGQSATGSVDAVVTVNAWTRISPILPPDIAGHEAGSYETLTGEPARIEYTIAALTNDAVLTWHWEPTAYLWNVSAGLGGSVEGTESGWYEPGTVVSNLAIPREDCRLLQWTGVPPGLATNNPLILTLDAGYPDVTARFRSIRPGGFLLQIIGRSPPED